MKFGLVGQSTIAARFLLAMGIAFFEAELIQSESSGVYNQKCQLLVFNPPRLWINLRLILVSGKTKEFLFSPNDSAADIAKHVYDNWPMDWEEEQVSSPNILRLIYQGRFLHGNVTLGALKLPFGKTTVMHLVARETLPEPNSQGSRIQMILPKKVMPTPIFLFAVCNDVEAAYIFHLSGVVTFVPIDTNGSSRLPCDSEALQGQKDDQVGDWSASVN
ncbi:hypothetical protein BTVI_26104 [Pitangus sulphuratus]|nr:hypothetical protein BTVI_26104 [Pitangus sulphuratus]